jgi:NADPH:quinone reductase-like Zn-dependent oxidoreductase
MDYRSAVAAAGNAGGGSLETTVYPFILRAVCLLGVESVYTPIERRIAAWERLARDLSRETLRTMTQRVPLERVTEAAGEIVAGRVRGRIVITLEAGETPAA